MQGVLRSLTTIGALLLTTTGLCVGATVMARPQKDTIEIIVEGAAQQSNFALIFDKSRAGISGWYDLDKDPKMERNLAPQGKGHRHSLFHSLAEIHLSDRKITIGPAAAGSMSLVENRPERVVINFTGRIAKWNGLRASDEFPKLIELTTGKIVAGDQLPTYEIRYTIYPTGAIYVQLVWTVHGVPLLVLSHHATLATVASDEFVALNDWRLQKRPFTWPATFLLHHGTGPQYQSDVLLSIHFNRFRSDWLGQHTASSKYKCGWFRSGFNMTPSPLKLPEGRYSWEFLLHVEPGTSGQRDPAFDVSEDYRHPATLELTGKGWGGLDVNGPGDANSDGFSERNGAYNLVSGPKGVRFNISGKTYPRIRPVFRISGWKGRAPEILRMDNKVLTRTKDYNTYVNEGVLVLQYLGVIRERKAHFELLHNIGP